MRSRRRTHHSHVAWSGSDEEFQSQTPQPAWDAAWDRVRAERKQAGLPNTGTISRHIICSGQLFAQFFRGHPEELPEAQRGQLQAQEAVRRLILSVPGPELV